MSGPSDLARLSVTIDTVNELLLSDQVKMMDVGGGVMRPTNAKAIADLAVQMTGAMIYTSKETGLVGSVAGGFFSVLSSDPNEYLILYRNDAGVAIEVKRYPSSEFIDFLIGKMASLLPDNGIQMGATYDQHGAYRLSVTDEKGKLMIGVGERIIKWMGSRIEVSADGRMGLMDSTGRSAISVDSKGRLYVAMLSVGQLKVLDPSFKPGKALPLPFGQHKQTGIMHWTYDGQSLGVGVAAVPAISVTQPYSNITFTSGVVPRPKDPGFVGSGVKPLVEETWAAYGDEGDIGETPASGTLNGLVRRLVMRGEDSTKWIFLGHRTGQSGQTVESLSPNGGANTFAGILATIDSAKAYADANNLTYSFWGHVFFQGEANIKTLVASDARDAQEYGNRVIRQDQALADYIAEKGYQDFRHALFLFQTSAHRRYGFDNLNVSNAQWGLSRQHAHTVLVGPNYHIAKASDNLHFTNEGSWLMGAYTSRAAYQTCAVHGSKWRPLEPVSVHWTSAFIDLKFHVPYGELVLDSALCATVPTGYFGFDIRETGVVATDLISSVAVTASDTVRISLTRPASADSLLSYARGRATDPNVSNPTAGPRGNLRDTHGLVDQVTSPLGNTFALHNACVMFEHHRINGFS
jgi:hypothetical protein